jgi:putative transposase
MQLRYNFRVYPTPGQQIALARAFGCARVVYNDALTVRGNARREGLPYVTDAELSKALTAAKKDPGGCGSGRCRRWCCNKRSPT